ncbi:MAG: 2-amino-4-hydroxy-6-hydroxymethyldihydropteridine diphosphokinase [Elusimicrobiota bacterium]
MVKTVTSYIGLGSNLRNRRKNIIRALELLNRNPSIVPQKCSTLKETEPWGYKKQPKFLNLVAEIKTVLASEKLLSVLKKIEKKLGRKKTFKWGPRVIDLDILLYGRKSVNTPSLVIPHPQLSRRKFILDALNELTPRPASLTLRRDTPLRVVR